MNYSSKKEQINIYLGKLFREFQNLPKATILLGAITTPIIIRLVTGGKSFFNGSDGNTAAFILMCACLWLGIFNSITSICKEREIIKHEYREGLDINSYILSHMIFQAFITLIETVIITILMTIFYFKNFSNIFLVLPLFISIFLIIYSADMLGLLLSSVVKSVSEAMTVMPFVLLVQLVLSGQIKLDNIFLQFLSFFTVSKNGFDSILSLSGSERRTGLSINSFLNATDYDKVWNFKLTWVVLIALGILFGFLASKILEKNINKN